MILNFLKSSFYLYIINYLELDFSFIIIRKKVKNNLRNTILS